MGAATIGRRIPPGLTTIKPIPLNHAQQQTSLGFGGCLGTCPGQSAGCALLRIVSVVVAVWWCVRALVFVHVQDGVGECARWCIVLMYARVMSRRFVVVVASSSLTSRPWVCCLRPSARELPAGLVPVHVELSSRRRLGADPPLDRRRLCTRSGSSGRRCGTWLRAAGSGPGVVYERCDRVGEPLRPEAQLGG